MHDALDVMLESGHDKILVAQDESGTGEVYGSLRLSDLMAAIAEGSSDEPAEIDRPAGS
jgi:CBS domain containing-hemolysin-like protein